MATNLMNQDRQTSRQSDGARGMTSDVVDEHVADSPRIPTFFQMGALWEDGVLRAERDLLCRLVLFVLELVPAAYRITGSRWKKRRREIMR